MATQMSDLPDPLDSGAGQLGRQWAAEEGAATVPLAVGADERERIACMGFGPEDRVEGAGVPAAERGDVQVVAVRSHTLPGRVWAA